MFAKIGLETIVGWINFWDFVHFNLPKRSKPWCVVSPSVHTDLDCRIVSKKDFQTSFLGQKHLIAWHLKILINGFWLIKRRFLLFGTKLARNQHKNIQQFWWFFSFCPFYGQKMQEKVSKSQNADKNGLAEYLTMNFRQFLLSCILIWRSGYFLDAFGPSRSVCRAQSELKIQTG